MRVFPFLQVIDSYAGFCVSTALVLVCPPPLVHLKKERLIWMLSVVLVKLVIFQVLKSIAE
jgi:hypothetical protein